MKRYKREKTPLQELLNIIITSTNDDVCEDLESKHKTCSLGELWKEHVKRDSDLTN